MKNYKNYLIEDFLLDDSFRKWVQNGCPIEEDFWINYPIIYPENKEEFSEAIKFVKEWMNRPSILSHEQALQDIQWILEDINDKNPVPNKTWYRYIGYAAMLTFILGCGGYFFYKNDSEKSIIAQNNPSENQIKVSNSGKKDKFIQLPDGSKVTLFPGSDISYDANFKHDSIRKVYLSGDAFFNVARNPAQPFSVHSGNLTTRVLGTSFTVKSGIKDISVIVSTGIVAVSKSNHESEKMILLPNQKAVYNPEIQQLTKAIGQTHQLAEGQEVKQTGSFDEEPVVNIIKDLERAYQISILYDDSKLKNCRVTLPFKNEPFDQKLDILCRTIQASYIVTDEGIRIESEGCE